jgi:hypothetical protein
MPLPIPENYAAKVGEKVIHNSSVNVRGELRAYEE